MKLSVRELQLADIANVVDYFINADAEFLKGMGAYKSKLPKKKEWTDKLIIEMKKSYAQKAFYYLIWLADNQPIGHCNVNNIQFEESATMHLHLWKKDKRKMDLGWSFLN